MHAVELLACGSRTVHAVTLRLVCYRWNACGSPTVHAVTLACVHQPDDAYGSSTGGFDSAMTDVLAGNECIRLVQVIPVSDA